MADKYAHLKAERSRTCWREDGIPKARYTKTEARKKAREYAGYHAYRCPECEGWHTGKYRPKTKTLRQVREEGSQQ